MAAVFRTGIENLVTRHKGWIKGRNLALASHAAAVNSGGRHSIDLLLKASTRLKALFGPEHGFAGTAGAGKAVKTARHRKHGIPVFSLYGETRKPTREMLNGIDTVIIDFQDLPFRCYTYLATTMYIMQAAEENGIEVIITDRPVPLPNTVDGPPLTNGFRSFIAPAELPLAYGMTPGETALWIYKFMKIKPGLRISRMSGYGREEQSQPHWPDWVNPSPGITSWDSALSYLATVSCEALPALSTFRGSALSFQAFSTPWLDAAAVAEHLARQHLRGVIFHPVPESRTVLIEVTSPASFMPVRTAVSILHAIQRVHGTAALWNCEGARPDFFDKLFGGASTRNALMHGRSPCAVAAQWRRSIDRFRRQRRSVLLYPKGKGL